MDNRVKIRIKNIIKEIHALAGDSDRWFLNPNIAIRLNWLKNLEYYNER